MAKFSLEPQYLFKLASMPRGFLSEQPVNHRCMVPKNTITIDFLGNCFLCECDGHLPLPVGQVQDFETINQLFESESARMILDDVSQGNFSWCAVDHCGIRTGDKIRNQLRLQINIDESCNLRCPSCRRDSIMVIQGPEYEKKLQDTERILHWLETYNDPIHIVMSGNGDPLASHIMRPLIKNWSPKSNQEFTVFTNGLLIRKQLDGIPILKHVRQFKISVDAGSAEVYAKVRPPGVWKTLLENFDFLVEKNLAHITVLNFAFQQKNYRDLPNFVSLCEQYGFIGVVHQLDNWGTWKIMASPSTDPWTAEHGYFFQQDVLNSAHPEHAEALQMVDRYALHPKIQWSPNLLLKVK